MLKQCKQCVTKFEITDQDLQFYDKVSPIIAGKKYPVPAPTFCPDCRQQRRLAFRNERKLYHRKCDKTGKSVISNYGPHTQIKIYDQEEWWKDDWDPTSYGQDFDFNKPFFKQFKELQNKVPHLALGVWNSENSSYCNYVGNVKNSYLIFGSVYSEDCYYGSPYYSKNCVDTLVVRECERCYECIDCRKLYECFYCQDCHGSNNLIYCFDLQGCKDCIGCAGLRNKQYYIFNKPATKDQYEKFKKDLNLCAPAARQKLSTELEKIKLTIPHRYMQSKNVENVSGNYVYQSKNTTDSYYADRCEDCRYSAQVVDLKDCQDNNYTEENELCYEYIGAYHVARTIFSGFSNRVSECLYSKDCFTSKNLFGCIGLRNKQYCILNKQYTKKQYEELVPQIIEHMIKNREWGEYFPLSASPFGYNETVASEYFPLNKAEALKLGANWKDDDEINRYQGPKLKIEADIKKINENILKEILTCAKCEKNYKVIKPELDFYKTSNLPIPEKCPDCRHNSRLAARNPRKLWDRKCAKCKAEIRTSFSPERSEIIYCESCYLKEVY